MPLRQPDPDLHTLCALFPASDDIADFQYIAPDEVPQPYHDLLVHEHHMTVTVEHYQGAPVNVHILDLRHLGDSYARKILLTLQGSDKVVQFGIARVHLNYCSPGVRADILAGKTPLGRVLIQHNVLRRIEPTAFLRVIPGPTMQRWFGLEPPTPTYGRLGVIYCDGQPAVEVLEIVAPVG